jgi:DNA topoisomerase-1
MSVTDGKGEAKVSKLVIVESPTKARTIERYLGKGYKVLSSMGHVRDLPEKELAVDLERDFEPKLIVINRKAVSKLRKAIADAETIYLATDNDREGEAIAFDLYEVLDHRRKKRYLRVVFNEITRRVILEAIEHPTQIDMGKVEAQRARRILDRLVGYLISPLLSKTLSGSKYEGLSAGRVQSVALRLICDRELEIQAFVPQEYWTIDAKLSDGAEFLARLIRIAGKKPEIPTKEEAERIRLKLEEIARSQGFVVRDFKEEESKRSPLPPFITSTLQQAASSMLRFSPQRTMQVAQQLYEGIEIEEGHEGLITYMRTDSLRVADEARRLLRGFVKAQYGEEYLVPKERVFKNKRAAQDAHEAIRPTDVRRTPDSIRGFLTQDQYKLYKLIWGRFVATQMADARYTKRQASIQAGEYLFEAKGSKLIFDGFLKAWQMPPLKDEGVEVPQLKEGELLKLLEILAEQRFTEPPKRYSEASLVKALEEKGIGRPSTYATIVSTIQERGYVTKAKGTLRPTLLGFIATDFLKDYFPLAVEEGFTAHMEEELDKISSGELTRVQVLREFYEPLSKRLAQVQEELRGSGPKVFRILSDVSCPSCSALMEVRFWKGKAFLGCSNYPKCKETIDFPEGVEYVYRGRQVLVGENLQVHHKKGIEAQGRSCPKCGAAMELRQGRFGRFYGCTRYPECKTTEPVSTGVPCPLCGRDIVERYAKSKRKVFYGCQGYPDCKFAVNSRPVKLCPKCDAGVLVEHGDDELICSAKGCGHREAAESSVVAAES